MSASPLLLDGGPADPGAGTKGDPAAAKATEAAKVALIEAHLDPVWRFLRRLGLSPADADDAAQEVFLVAMQRFDTIVPESAKSFLFGIALRIASRRRRNVKTQLQRSVASDVDAYAGGGMASDEVVLRREALELLDRALAYLPDDTRTVFVLYELEELTMQEIANVTGAPIGTVGSRLRRAREEFEKITRRMQKTRQT